MIMKEIWHKIVYETDASDAQFRAHACAHAGSPWFSGHFPNDPILPGIAIMAMAAQVARHHELIRGRKIGITAIRKVRFRLPVRPDELLTISLLRPGKDLDMSYHFNVELNGKTVCTGILTAATLPE